MTCFSRRSGKDELYRVAEFLRDVELPERTDAVIGALALAIVGMVKTSPEDEASRMAFLLRLMENVQ